MRRFLLLGLLGLGPVAHGQTPARAVSPLVGHLPADSSRVLTFALRMPQLRGGGDLRAVAAQLERPLRPASTSAPKSGRLLIEFLVGPSGRIYQPAVLQGLSPEWDARALAAIRRLAVLAPGVQHGKRVPVRLRMWLTVGAPATAPR